METHSKCRKRRPTLKKNTIAKRKPTAGKAASKVSKGRMTIGLDLGDKSSRFCELDASGDTVAEGSVLTTKKGLRQRFGGKRRCRIALEVGTHSPWISRLLSKLGHEVIVANARQVRLISESSRKDDRMDARMLARLARVDPQLLRPIRHRSEKAQLDLVAVRVRATLVEARTMMINSARGLAKSLGERLPACDADNMSIERIGELPKELQSLLKPLLKQIEILTGQIEEQDKRLEQIARSEYPETSLLRQVHGVGPIIALTFVLTLEDKERFAKSRDVGCYVGLQPKRSQSGDREPQLGITKEGDRYLRMLLVQGAQGVLRQNAPDTDLKRWGLQLASRGGKNAKKRAIVGVARKLAVLLHRLWVTGEEYEPLRNSLARERQSKTAA
jgi:transposase